MRQLRLLSLFILVFSRTSVQPDESSKSRRHKFRHVDANISHNDNISTLYNCWKDGVWLWGDIRCSLLLEFYNYCILVDSLISVLPGVLAALLIFLVGRCPLGN